MSQNPVSGGGTTVTYLGKVSTPQPRILTMGTQSAINPSSVKVTNTGDTGVMQNAAVIEGNVPADVPSMSFNIGNSLAVSNSNSHNNPKVVTAGSPSNGLVASIRVVGDDEDLTFEGGDPNIIGAQQVPAGTPVRQGPHGPVILTPRPSTISVSQTPMAPQVTPRPHFPQRQEAAGAATPGGSAGHQTPGPGNYRPPFANTPRPMSGPPGSGQQILKNIVAERQKLQQRQQHRQQLAMMEKHRELHEQQKAKERLMHQIQQQQGQQMQQHQRQDQQRRQHDHRQRAQQQQQYQQLQQQKREHMLPSQKHEVVAVATPLPNVPENRIDDFAATRQPNSLATREVIIHSGVKYMLNFGQCQQYQREKSN